MAATTQPPPRKAETRRTRPARTKSLPPNRCVRSHTSSLASEEVWLRTHRFGGRLFVLAGLVLLVSAFLGGGWVVAAIATGLAAVLSVVYSYLVYRRVEGFKESAPRSA